MTERGHDRDTLQCRVKVKELWNAYHKAREANCCSGAVPKSCQFYKKLDATSAAKATVDTSEARLAVKSGLSQEEEILDEDVDVEGEGDPEAEDDSERMLDMTFGAGGHTKALLQKVTDITIYALDRDPAAYKVAQQLSESYPVLIFSSFTQQYLGSRKTNSSSSSVPMDAPHQSRAKKSREINLRLLTMECSLQPPSDPGLSSIIVDYPPWKDVEEEKEDSQKVSSVSFRDSPYTPLWESTFIQWFIPSCGKFTVMREQNSKKILNMVTQIIFNKYMEKHSLEFSVCQHNFAIRHPGEMKSRLCFFQPTCLGQYVAALQSLLTKPSHAGSSSMVDEHKGIKGHFTPVHTIGYHLALK
ncbi:Putative methyltransferase-like protein 15 [Chelonia mydas]|uniref:Putative methyltransferase-like protein 15 n=1 Tax=Chelonia mydas TaxID=8469 RepID=M7BIN8_CHEMY|nr:Putative methyltransferase-like protein 15 [Chelonia mydas]